MRRFWMLLPEIVPLPATRAAPRRLCGFAFLTAASALACSDGDTTSAAPGAPGEGPLYALMTQLYGTDDDRTVYVSLSDTLDISSTSLETAREFPGVANLAAISGRLLISSGLAPTITEYDITADHTWVEGRMVSFAGYPLFDNANFYYQFVVDDSRVILPYEGTKRLVWNPQEMAITGTLEDSTLPEPEPGLLLEAGGNRNGIRYDGAIMQSIFYHDEDWYDFGERSHVVVYDRDTLAEERVIDIPCPGLSMATTDEAGNTYFATWDVPATSMLGTAPPTCVAKIGPERTLEDTLDLRDWTEGRIANNFRYVGGGKAFANVLHHEELGVAAPSELAPEAIAELGLSGPHWKLWLFDVATGAGQPVQGIDIELGSGAQLAVIDDRTFVFVPYQDWGRTRAYELDADGVATEHFDTSGDVFKWVKVR